GIVNAADMNIRVVAVAEAAQVASAETGHADVVVVHEPIEQAGAPGEVEVGSSCRHLLVHWRGEGAAELRELGNDGEALRVLVGLFVFHMPEQLVLDEGPAGASAEVLAVKRRLCCCGRGLIQSLVGGKAGIAEKSEAGPVDVIGAAARD